MYVLNTFIIGVQDDNIKLICYFDMLPFYPYLKSVGNSCAPTHVLSHTILQATTQGKTHGVVSCSLHFSVHIS